MQHTASIEGIKLARLSPANLPTSQSSIAKIIVSWRTGLEYRRRIRFTSKANAYCEAVVCAVLSAVLDAQTMISAEDSGHYSRRQPKRLPCNPKTAQVVALIWVTHRT